MKVKRSCLASLFASWMLWIGFFCLSFCISPPQAEAIYGGGRQAETFPQVMSSQKLAGIARQQLELELYKVGEGRRHVLTLTTSPQDMRLPAGKIRYEAEIPGKLRYGNVQPVHIRIFVDEKLYRRAICYYRVQVFEKVLVAGMNLPIEQPIGANAVRLEEREVMGGEGRYLTKFEDIAGRVPIRYVHMGQLIEQNMLQNPVVINPNAPVKLIVNYNGVQVSAEGIALQKGRVGGMIRVRNARSGRMMQGKVIAADTVEITGH